MDACFDPVFQVDPELIRRGGVSKPTNGEQFLANVILERLYCKEVVRAPVKVTNEKQNIFAPEYTTIAPAPSQLLPTLEWQNFQVLQFSQLRNDISQKREQQETQNEPTIPDFSFIKSWKNYFKEHEPILSLVFTFNHNTLIELLVIICRILKENLDSEEINKIYGKWLYAVLACIKLPLTPDIHSTLRDIAKRCSEIRSNLLPEDEDILKKKAPLNLFICLIARYFNQTDLAD